MKITVLDGYTLNPGDLSWNFLEEYGEYKVYDSTEQDKVVERCINSDIIVTNKVQITKEIIEQLPNLKFIAVLATGYNVIDTKCAKEHNILVANIPSYSTEAVAQLVFSFMLELSTNTARHSDSVKNGDWSSSPHFSYHITPLYELYNKTIGIIGLGQIGKAVAKRANAFGMRVIAYAPRTPKEKPDYVKLTSLDKLINESDFITLHCPLTEETKNLVNGEFLSKMKSTAYLINTSRGPVIDENALADALNSGKIAGAGLDVLSVEPPKADNPILSAENCFITPHIAWAAFETRERLMNIFKENIKGFVNNKPINIVNN